MTSVVFWVLAPLAVASGANIENCFMKSKLTRTEDLTMIRRKFAKHNEHFFV